MSSVVDVVLRKEMVKVHFHDFPNLPNGTCASTLSPKFVCLGRFWQVRLYPGGTATSDLGYISVFLCTAATDNASTEGFGFLLCVRGPTTKYQHCGDFFLGRESAFAGRQAIPRPGTPGQRLCQSGSNDFAKLSSITKCLDNGILVIEVTVWSLQGVCARESLQYKYAQAVHG